MFGNINDTFKEIRVFGNCHKDGTFSSEDNLRSSHENMNVKYTIDCTGTFSQQGTDDIPVSSRKLMCE